MKKLIYSALIASLALAISVQAADEKQKKAKGGRGGASVQRAQVKGHGPAQAKIHQNSKAIGAQHRAVNPGRNKAAVVKQNNFQNNGGNAALRHQNKVNNVAVQQGAVKTQRQNAKLARTQAAASAQQNAALNPQQNVVVNNQGKVRANRTRNVAITNNWRGSGFDGQQYSAFRNYHRQRHDRNWYSSRYNRIVLFGGGNYYWDNGYWYPAWGYNSGYNYSYDGPIYGYNDLAPGEVVTNVQARLQQDGYYEGSIDGSLGPMTRRALAAFQADHGLAITSAIDQPTLATLGLV